MDEELGEDWRNFKYSHSSKAENNANPNSNHQLIEINQTGEEKGKKKRKSPRG